MATTLYLPDPGAWPSTLPDTPVTPRDTLNASATSPIDTQASVSAENAPLRVIYGEVRLGPLISTVLPYLQGNVILAVWGHGEVDEIVSMSIDDVEIALGSITTLPTLGKDGTFTGGGTAPINGNVRNYTGKTAQTADTLLIDAFAGQGLTYADNLPGICYSVIYVPTGTSTGFPRINAKIRGLKVWTGATTEWSDNPAYCLADFITHATYGAKRTVDWASVASVAADCNALVGGEKRRTLNLALETVQPVQSWLDTLRTYAGCWITQDGADLKLIADKAGSVVASISHAAGQIKTIGQVKKRGVQSVPTVMSLTYTDTTALPYKPGTVTVYADGVLAGTTPRRESTVSLPGINRYSQAKREAIERLNKLALNDLSMTLGVFDDALALEVGDIVEVTHPMGFSAKKLRVQSVVGEYGRFELGLLEYDPAVYDDTVATAPTWVDTDLPDPVAAFADTALALVPFEPGPQGPPGPQGEPGAAGAQGPAGADGVTLYTWIAYADNTTGLNFTTGSGTGRLYIGIANNKTLSTESTNYADYTWSLIKGDAGVPGTPGADGTTTYTWFAYANDATGSSGFTTGAWTNQTYLGIATNKTTATESTNPAEYFWSKIQGATGPQGPSGTNGNYTSYVFIASLTTPSAPTGTAVVPAGWYDAPPSSTYPIWMSKATVSGSTGLAGAWSTPVKVSGSDGVDGTDGVRTTYEYNKGTSSAVTSSWQSTPHTLSAGEFGWMREVRTFPQIGNANIVSAIFSNWSGTGGNNAVLTGQSTSIDGYVLKNGYASHYIPVNSPASNFSPGGDYTLSFDAWLGADGTRGMVIDLYPDTLPESIVTVTSTRQTFVLHWYSQHSDLNSCHMRFFAPAGSAGQDIYICNIKFEHGTQQTPWCRPTSESVEYGTAYRITGETGATGPQGNTGPQGAAGVRGSVTRYVSGQTSWNDTTANNALPSLPQVIGDTVTFTNGSTYSETKYWGGSSWLAPGVILDGNLLVSGSVSAAKIDSRGLDIKNAAGEVILSSGTSYIPTTGNMIMNSGPSLGTGIGLFVNGWHNTATAPSDINYDTNWGPVGVNNVFRYGNNYPVGVIDISYSTLFSVNEGRPYEASAYFGNHRSQYAQVVITFFNSGGASVGEYGGTAVNDCAIYRGELSQYVRSYLIVTAPTGAVTARVFARMVCNGQDIPHMFTFCWYFGRARSGQTAPTAWSDGAAVFIGSSVRFPDGTSLATGDFVNRLAKISTGNISTFIDTAAIGDAYIGNLNASKINAGYISADRIASGSITAGKIDAKGLSILDASGNLILSAGSSLQAQTATGENVHPDPYFNNVLWWSSGSRSTWAAANATVADGDAAAGQPRKFLRFTSGSLDMYSSMLPLEQGGTYRLKVHVYVSPDAAGQFWAGVHLPWQAWWSPYAMNTGDPAAGWNLTPLKGVWSHSTTVAAAARNECQFRIWNTLTAGYVEVAFELNRIWSFSNTNDIAGQITSSNVSTFIANAAIQSAHIGSLTADVITAGTLNVDRINAGSIGTVKITDNAVTARASSTISGTNTVSSTLATVFSVTAYFDGQFDTALPTTSAASTLEITLESKSTSSSGSVYRLLVSYFLAGQGEVYVGVRDVHIAVGDTYGSVTSTLRASNVPAGQINVRVRLFSSITPGLSIYDTIDVFAIAYQK